MGEIEYYTKNEILMSTPYDKEIFPIKVDLIDGDIVIKECGKAKNWYDIVDILNNNKFDFYPACIENSRKHPKFNFISKDKLIFGQLPTAGDFLTDGINRKNPYGYFSNALSWLYTDESQISTDIFGNYIAAVPDRYCSECSKLRPVINTNDIVIHIIDRYLRFRALYGQLYLAFRHNIRNNLGYIDMTEDAHTKYLYEVNMYVARALRKIEQSGIKVNSIGNIPDNLPNTEGIYIFVSERLNFCYIGKAKKMRSRMNQHINGISQMVDWFTKKEYISAIYYIDLKDAPKGMTLDVLEQTVFNTYKEIANDAGYNAAYNPCYCSPCPAAFCLNLLNLMSPIFDENKELGAIN